MMNGISVKIAESQDDIEQAFKIRETVFMGEQKVSREEEMDEFDRTATHIIAYYNDKVAGCARIRFMGEKAKLERLAILKEFRKKGVGKKVLEFMIAHSKEKGAVEAYGHAQLYARDFYEKCGFKARGEEFMEANIRHIEMYMRL
jgi:predicted GNAT family N-acyltransferase